MNTSQPQDQAEADRAASMLYEQVQALLQNGDVASAQLATAQITHKDYQGFALKAVAQAQVQAGDLAGAEVTAQAMPYWDARGDEVGRIAKAHLSRGDIAKAQQLAATMRSAYAWPSLTRAIAEALVRAGAPDEARRTLVAAQQHLQTWSAGDHWHGYPREDALCEIVQAQLGIGDVRGANQTARSITRPDYQRQALRAVLEQATSAAGIDRKDAGPA